MTQSHKLIYFHVIVFVYHLSTVLAYLTDVKVEAL